MGFSTWPFRAKLLLATVCLAGLVVAAWALMLDMLGREHQGTALRAGDVPHYGRLLDGLETRGPVTYAYWRNYRMDRVAISGTASSSAIARFCDTHGIRRTDYSPKWVDFSGLVRGLGGDPRGFATRFSRSDLRYIGGLGRGGSPFDLDLRLRSEDERFLLLLAR